MSLKRKKGLQTSLPVEALARARKGRLKGTGTGFR